MTRPARRERPLMGLGFWLLLGFGFFCVMAGIGVAVLGPRLPAAPSEAAERP